MNTGNWSELIAEHEVRYTAKERSLFITMSKTSGVAERLCGFVVVVVHSKDQTGVLVAIIT